MSTATAVAPAPPSKAALAQTFLKSLSVLLHACRIYGADHRRTKGQLEAAWRDLCAVVAQCGEEGLILGVSGSLLLVGGTPARHNPRLDTMLRMLARGRISSLRFASRVTFDDFLLFVHAFSSAEKNEVLADHLRTHLPEKCTVSVNSVRYVPEDSSQETAVLSNNLTAALMAGALGGDAQKLQSWMDDPGKLLQLVLASEGTRGGGARAGAGAAPAGAAAGPGAVAAGGGAGTAAGAVTGTGVGTGARGRMGAGAAAAPGAEPGIITLREEDLEAIIRMLSALAESVPRGAAPEPARVREQMQSLSQPAAAALRDALERLQSVARTSEPPDGKMIVRVAEQLAIRLALERYQEGKTPLNIIQNMLNRMAREIKRLREILYLRTSGGFSESEDIEYHDEDLTLQFWMALPPPAVLSVLRSPQAWSVPARIVREVVDRLEELHSPEIGFLLQNLVNCLKNTDAEVQHKTAARLIELADIYVRPQLGITRAIVESLAALVAQSPNQQYEVTAVLARFLELAFEARALPVLRDLLAGTRHLAAEHPWTAEQLWPRVGLDRYLPELIEEALRAPEILAPLVSALREAPGWTIKHLAQRLMTCSRRRERDRVVQLAREMGAEGTQYLKEMFPKEGREEAALAVGLLLCLDPDALQHDLLERIRHWDLTEQDALVRQLAASGVEQRGRLLSVLLPRLHPLIRPLAVEEMAMSRDPACAPILIGVAGGHHPDWASLFLRVKAIEALAYLRSKEAAPVLFSLVEERRLLGWAHHEELRLTAAQALLQIDPGWAESALTASGLNKADLKLALSRPGAAPVGVRKRLYPRVRLPRPLTVRLLLAEGEKKAEIRDLSMGGGPFPIREPLPDGADGTVELRIGMRTLRPAVLLRARRSGPMAFQFVDMTLDERLLLRRLLLEAQGK